MTREVIVVPPELPLAHAWEIMQRRRIRHLPVTSGGTLLGILSDRDVLLHAQPHPETSTPLVPDMPVAVAMTPSPATCERTTTIKDIVRVMVERKIDSVIVVDAAGSLIGLVTSTDVMQLLLGGDPLRPLPYDFEIRGEDTAAI